MNMQEAIMTANALQFENKVALEANLSQLKAEFLMSGVKAIDPAMFSIERFANLSAEQQQVILTNISSYLQILSENISPVKNRREYEIERLKCALRSFNLRLNNNDFFEKIGEEDFIELYNAQNIQIYRSVKFFNLCSYSLLDLSVNSWDELYEKPVGVMAPLIEQIEQSKREQVTIPVQMGSFVQREKFAYASAAALRAFHVNFRWLTPLINQNTGATDGFLCTFTADVLGEGSSSNKFSVI